MPRKKAAKAPAKKAPSYRSGYEKKVKESLERHGVDFKYESEHLKYNVPASNHRYVPDFTLPNTVIIEAKGKFDAAARKKMMLVIEQNPGRDIRMLFMRNNKLNKSSKTTYGDWCDKRGIKWAVSLNGEVPEEWVAELKKEKEHKGPK